jgi:hypothetical protein
MAPLADYCRWVVFWSALAASAILIGASYLLMPAHAGPVYALAVGFVVSIVNFRIACADLPDLGDLSKPGAARGVIARSFLRHALKAGAVAVALALDGLTLPVAAAAVGGLFLARAVAAVETVFGLTHRSRTGPGA